MNSNTTAKMNTGTDYLPPEASWSDQLGKELLFVPQRIQRHLYHTAWFNINLPIGPPLQATAGKQNEIQHKSQLQSKGVWHYMGKAAKVKWL